jgi:beta-N-acetylhexosaminidase
MLAFGFEGSAIPPDVLELAAAGGLGGVVLFARNCPTVEAVFALTEAARGLGPDVLVLVDHEGGRVHRLPPPFTRFPPAAAIGRAGDPSLAGAVARAMARELRAAGFDSGLAPVLDCLTESASTAIGDRAFGPDPERVAACGEAFVRSALAEGLIPVAKHFPGHGRTAVDSHHALPRVDVPIEALRTVELVPFVRALRAGCPAVLVAHVLYPQLDPEWPASMSGPAIRGLLRTGLGFDGLVLSDDLEMAAVAGGWGIAAATTRFLQAGGDLALVCRDEAARAQAMTAVRTLLEEGRVTRDHGRDRRAALRARVAAAGRRPDPSVIGAPEHRALAEEIAHRAADQTVQARARTRL